MTEADLQEIERKMSEHSMGFYADVGTAEQDMRALIAEVRRLRDFEDDERTAYCSPKELQRAQRVVNLERTRMIDAMDKKAWPND